MAKFQSEHEFTKAFAVAYINRLSRVCTYAPVTSELHTLTNYLEKSESPMDLVDLFVEIANICTLSDKPIVLMIDEVDSATNNQIFLEFLAKLRGYYLDRDYTPTFHAVILAGVHDIKNLKMKLHPEQDSKTNSPWNIAADFDIDMSFSAGDIATMLREYEQDHLTGMNISEIDHYIIEAQTCDISRTDVIIDYRGKQYIIEMKIWRGDEYNQRGEQQLTEYWIIMDYKKGIC